MVAYRCPLWLALVRDDFVLEQQREQHRDDGGEPSGIDPDRAPVVAAIDRERGGQLPGDPKTDQHADAVRRQRDEPLRGALVAWPGFGVREDLARDEEE